MDILPISEPPSTSCGLETSPGMRTSRAVVDTASPAVKPKQSKSRNGCVTCKAKRLKCDESKPTCHQCQKRGVPCGGYKKDFKWRPFEESTMAGKPPKPSRRGIGMHRSRKSPPPTRSNQRVVYEQYDSSSSVLPFEQDSPMPYSNPALMTSTAFDLDPIFITSNDSLAQLQTPPRTAAVQIASNGRAIDAEIFGDGPSNQDSPILANMPLSRIEMTSRSLDAIQELLDLSAKRPDIYALSGMLQDHTPISIINNEIPETEIEEIIRGSLSRNNWISSPTPSTVSTSSSDSHSSHGSIYDIFRRPSVMVDSPEVLLSYFDKNTCGIMSVKDGPNENPWRTLIWPLARDSLALYHAISSMTAFHMSRERPYLRVEGMEHMRKSIRFLAQGLSHGNIREDAALGTTLVLAFSEAFDRHISTGIEHLRGARVLLNQALAKISPAAINREDEAFQRLRFLYNVWVYLDVLARLTSDGDDSHPPMSYAPLTASPEIDPLLGCAATLFPLIGQAASLVQRVRKSEKNSVGIISAATDLKILLESWQVESYYDPIVDPSSDVMHCITTAEAYRWATLLYLHQAVPEISSPSAHELAEKVMRLIASIPQHSRSCIVHIYPLLAAGCEAIGEEERSWVADRWESMTSRMWIGNVDKAWQVVKEVWHRRDTFQGRQTPSVSSPVHTSLSSDSRYESPTQDFYKRKYFDSNDADGVLSWNPVVFDDALTSPKRRLMLDSDTGRLQLERLGKGGGTSDVFQEPKKGEFEYEVSIKGRLHWLGVMKDWHWEVLLG